MKIVFTDCGDGRNTTAITQSTHFVRVSVDRYEIGVIYLASVRRSLFGIKRLSFGQTRWACRSNLRNMETGRHFGEYANSLEEAMQKMRAHVMRIKTVLNYEEVDTSGGYNGA